MIERIATQHSEKRRSARRRILKRCQLLINGGLVTLHATVRDISETGARMQLENACEFVPQRMTVFIELDGLRAEAELAWRKDAMLGVRFVQPPSHIHPPRTQVVGSSENALPKWIMNQYRN